MLYYGSKCSLTCALYSSYIYVYRVLPKKIFGIAGGCGLGGVCDHISHLGYQIKEKLVLKAWGAAMLKGPGENTETCRCC